MLPALEKSRLGGSWNERLPRLLAQYVARRPAVRCI
jgi:hypothetical protein